MEFTIVNIHGNPEGLARLRSLGARSVPVVARGGRFVYGLQLPEVAGLVGKPYEERAKLSPAQLVEKSRLVLRAVQRYMRQVPLEGLEMKSPDRDRPLRLLAFHCFHLTQAFIDAYAKGEMTAGALNGSAGAATMTSGDDIAAYGEGVLQNLDRWWDEAQSQPFDRWLDTFYGSQTAHELFERTAWHAAQHQRQILLFLSWINIVPDGPLTEADLAGLPLPDAVW